MEGRSKPLDELLRERNALIVKKNIEQGDSAAGTTEGNLLTALEYFEFKERLEQIHPIEFKFLRRQLLYYLKKPLSDGM